MNSDKAHPIDTRSHHHRRQPQQVTTRPRHRTKMRTYRRSCDTVIRTKATGNVEDEENSQNVRRNDTLIRRKMSRPPVHFRPISMVSKFSLNDLHLREKYLLRAKANKVDEWLKYGVDVPDITIRDRNDRLRHAEIMESKNFRTMDIDCAVDWIHQGQRDLGKEYLFSQMPVSEIDCLVDWAHNPHMHYLEYTAPEKQTVEARQSSLLSLIGLPSPPPKPSHLAFLASCARNKLIQSCRKRQEKQQSQRPDPVTVSKKRRTKIRADYSSLEDSDDTVGYDAPNHHNIYQLFKDFHRTKAVSVAFPPTKYDDSETIDYEDLMGVYESMDETALVALGMIIQEMLTAMLMPLAKQHVDRCTTLEKCFQFIQGQTKQKNEMDFFFQQQDPTLRIPSIRNPFIQWTLRPEEALVNLSKSSSYDSQLSLLSSVPPSNRIIDRSRQHNLTGVVSVVDSTPTNLNNVDANRTKSHGSIELQQFVDRWTKLHGFDPSFVAQNYDLFRLFLQRVPSPSWDLSLPQYVKMGRIKKRGCYVFHR